MKEANESEMIGERVSSLHEAFEVPMSTLFLGVLREDVISWGRERVHKRCVRESFVAAKKVLKGALGKKDKTFAKLSHRCNCKAMATFYIEANREWVCNKHDMIHDHKFFLEDEIYKLSLHKKMRKLMLCIPKDEKK